MNGHLARGAELNIKGRFFVVERIDENGDVQIRDTLTNNYSAYGMSLIVEMLTNGEAGFVVRNTAQTNNTAVPPVADLSLLPENSREDIKRRFLYVQRCISEKVTSFVRKKLEKIALEVSREIGSEKIPSYMSIFRWTKAYLQSGGDIRALAQRRRPGNRHIKFGIGPKHPETRRALEIAAETKEIIIDVIHRHYMKREQISGAAVRDHILIRIQDVNRFRREEDKLPYPSISAVHRRISEIDPYERDCARLGKRLADQRHKQFLMGVREDRPLARAETDHTKLPFLVVDTATRLPLGRPWLTVLIDKFSGIILGFYVSFEPPSANSIFQTLKHAIRPKGYIKELYPDIENDWTCWGLPETIASDNGIEFLSGHYADACLQLNINIDFMPVRKPWYKATVENYFGVMNKRLLARHKGKTFSNIIEKGDYDPAENAVVSFDALVEIVTRWIVDVYNQEVQKGYERTGPNRIPAVLWRDGIKEFPPAVPPGGADLDILLRMIDYRTISKNGVELFGNLYNHPALAGLRSAKKNKDVQIKYDSGDLSMVYVADAENGKYIPVPALDQQYTRGLTVYQNKIVRKFIREYLKTEMNSESLISAKRRIQEIVDAEMQTTKKVKSRTAAARWNKINSSMTEQKRSDKQTLPDADFFKSPTPAVPLLLPPATINNHVPPDEPEETPKPKPKKRKNEKPAKTAKNKTPQESEQMPAIKDETAETEPPAFGTEPHIRGGDHSDLTNRAGASASNDDLDDDTDGWSADFGLRIKK